MHGHARSCTAPSYSLCTKTFHTIMRNFKSFMTMFTQTISASLQNGMMGQVPVALDERKVSEAYDLVEAELYSPTFEVDYAHFVNHEDFPDENGAELVLAGMVVDHICEKLGLSEIETQTVKYHIKVMYLDVIRSFEKDAMDVVKNGLDESREPNWQEINLSTQVSTFEEFCKHTESEDKSEAASGKRFRLAQRINEKISLLYH